MLTDLIRLTLNVGMTPLRDAVLHTRPDESVPNEILAHPNTRVRERVTEVKYLTGYSEEVRGPQVRARQ